MIRLLYAVFSATLATLGAARVCQNLTIPISISARNGVFNLQAPANNIEVTNFILDLSRQGQNLTQKLLTDYHTVSGCYEIAATYCEPDNGPGPAVQVLTHGIGFDRSYWDLSYNAYNYSYAVYAAENFGYSTFAWDRLGIGMSSHGEPVNEIQLWLEVSALHALTTMLREGTMPGISCSYSKVLHVGHSFGSAQTYTLTTMYPDDSDGIALTGFSQNSSFTGYFELGGNFVEANTIPALSNYSKGYLAAGDTTGVHINFFAPDNFDPNLLQLASQTGQPVTPGELLTLAGATGQINQFLGPVLVITGERDIPYCGGDCLATGNAALVSIPATSAKYFPNASNFEAFIVPGAGHGLSLGYSHLLTSLTINNYFDQFVQEA